jgi:sulfoxide reductase catalytic subunit YedY
MLTKTGKPRYPRISENDVTDQGLYEKRRQFIKTGLQTGLGISLSSYFPILAMAAIQDFSESIASAKNTRPLEPDDELNTEEAITHYNNFYELGTGKEDPYRNADALITDPWTVTIEGECENPGDYAIDDILKPHDLEERIYRLRCVEAWSMVVPWVGFPLADLVKQFKPTSKAKYIAFETIYDKESPLPGQYRRSIEWPYREGLRMDEALNPLTFMAVGLYGKVMPNQNGAPLRLVVPWKYGFKSIKSIVKISFQEEQPPTSWNMINPREYGFYSNVNPKISHPRWSQARERRVGELFKRETLMFNGYADEVASMYSGMDLGKNY